MAEQQEDRQIRQFLRYKDRGKTFVRFSHPQVIHLAGFSLSGTESHLTPLDVYAAERDTDLLLTAAEARGLKVELIDVNNQNTSIHNLPPFRPHNLLINFKLGEIFQQIDPDSNTLLNKTWILSGMSLEQYRRGSYENSKIHFVAAEEFLKYYDPQKQQHKNYDGGADLIAGISLQGWELPKHFLANRVLEQGNAYIEEYLSSKDRRHSPYDDLATEIESILGNADGNLLVARETGRILRERMEKVQEQKQLQSSTKTQAPSPGPRMG